jgi:hypothetical protein
MMNAPPLNLDIRIRTKYLNFNKIGFDKKTSVNHIDINYLRNFTSLKNVLQRTRL